MKRLMLTGLVIAFCGATALQAQNNDSYVDDRYYSGSKAQEDAKASARKEQKAKNNRSEDGAEYYTSSGSSRYDGYDGSAETYNGSWSEYDDTYIDYDDDSYTTRMRRFNYPIAGVGYWGSVYSPYWYDPFYYDPFYSWGGWYRPGISFSFGWGGPYWNSCWGMSAWYGFGRFSYWGYPAYGYGWGGGFANWGMGYGGYWNGFYDGLYAGRYASPYRRSVNYGPRGAVGVRTSGNYAPGRNGNRGNGVVTPMNRLGSHRTIDNRAGNIRLNEQNTGQAPSRERMAGRNQGRDSRVENSRINLNNGSEGQRSISVDRDNRVSERYAPSPHSERRGGLFNRGNSSTSAPRENVDRGSRTPSAERHQPSRNYQQSTPSRSYNTPAPSRSSGGSFGGGSRSSGGSFGGSRSGGSSRGR